MADKKKIKIKDATVDMYQIKKQIEKKFKGDSKIKPAEMPKFHKKGDSKIKPAEMKPLPNPNKDYITVPLKPKKFKGGGIAARGLGRAFMKGGKVL
tara:strand:+ start:40 stop:327 length:288 start_codon:yes stop_codon:yes gene_type:complete